MNIYNKLRLFRYYMSTNNNHPVSITGILLDGLFINIIVWIFTYLWAVYRTKSPSISILLSLTIVVLMNIAIYIKKHKTYTINRKKRRRESAANYLSTRISLLNCQEFQLHLIKLLLNCKGFSDIYKEKGLLKADYNGIPTAIGFHHPPPGCQTPFAKVWEFVHQAKSLELQQGFFFTSSTFGEDCSMESIKNSGFSLQLMDVKYIIDMMEEGGMFPDENTIDKLIVGEIRKEKIRKQKLKKEILSSSKAKQYLFISILFFLAGLLFNSSRFYYLVISLLFATLALLVKLLAPEPSNTSEEPPASIDDKSPMH